MKAYEDEPAKTCDVAGAETDSLIESCNAMTDIADVVARIAPRHSVINRSIRETAMSYSVRDPLTGLFTRRYMEDSLGREFFRADRWRSTVAVAILNLDNFERFRVECGRAAANILLQAVGQLLQSRIRREDLVCRYGNEEFAAVMLEAPVGVARSRAEELRQQLRALPWCRNSRLKTPVTFSAGVAAYPGHATTPHSLLLVAHVAMEQAVTNGRDRVVVAARRAGAGA